MGVYHSLRKQHIARYLDEFVFRWNRRRWRNVAFDKLLGLSVRLAPMGYLNEFTFRFNRRFYPFNAFRSLLGIAGV